MTRYAAPNPMIQREILSFRLDVEPYVAMTAARRATARDLVALEEAFEGMKRHLQHGDSEEERRLHSDHDVAFHAAQAVLDGTAKALGIEAGDSALGKHLAMS